MHYVYLTDNVVTDQAQVNPFTIFTPSYAEGFIEVADEVTIGWVYSNGKFSPPPGPTPEEIQVENKQKAKSLLAETDYVTEVDVIDPSRNPHLLNQAEFLTYREEIRKIAVNPPTFVIENWPTKPTNVWGS